MLGEHLERWLKKDWTPVDVEHQVGEFRSTWLSHAQDPQVRAGAASGGSTSALLIEGLQRGFFEGAVVCTCVVEEGRIRARFQIMTTAEDILAARGSKYVETRFLHEVLPLIRNFDGRVAVVGLPCDISALRRHCEREPAIGEKLSLCVALVCGHNSRKALVDGITSKIERSTGKSIRDFRFRVGHWRGHLEAILEDGSVFRRPSSTFTDYQNLFYFCERKCMACHDHYGYAADLSMGDIWLYRLKSRPIKPNAVIVRTPLGEQCLQAAHESATLHLETIGIHDIMDGQARIGPAHYNVSARARAGRWLGIHLPDKLGVRVSWHAFLNALISLANMRLSETRAGRALIFALPRPALKLLLYFKKGLESLK